MIFGCAAGLPVYVCTELYVVRSAHVRIGRVLLFYWPISCISTVCDFQHLINATIFFVAINFFSSLQINKTRSVCSVQKETIALQPEYTHNKPKDGITILNMVGRRYNWKLIFINVVPQNMCVPIFNFISIISISCSIHLLLFFRWKSISGSTKNAIQLM